jgi:uncharacterized protein YbbC (DUF1343 family)
MDLSISYFIRLTLILACMTVYSCRGGVPAQNTGSGEPKILTGAEQPDEYLPLLKGKKVGVVANHTSLIGSTHLVDTLLASGINVVKAFGPEHGFRGTHGAGDKVSDDTDPATGIQVVSLYGANKKPTDEQLAGVDVMVFDIQDVGARFYTYISTLFYVLEACADLGIPVVVLDRPNPHSGYIDGPVLEDEYRSFVGICKIPVIHGLTVGEFAMLVNGEGWLDAEKKADLRVIRIRNYYHGAFHPIEVPPSPNLQDMDAIALYPSLCFFEGTPVSIGRGTSFPFKVYGYPGMHPYDTVFTPKPVPGVVSSPKFNGEECNGIFLANRVPEIMNAKKLDIGFLVSVYEQYPDKENFFTPFFDKLAGTDRLRKQITSGMNAEQIRATWRKDLDAYKKVRAGYLLYP